MCYTSGISQGNPGPGAVGVYVTDESGAMVEEAAQTIGNTTHNFAEYNAVLFGLQTLKEMFGANTTTMQFEIILDSELVKKQLNAEYQIKEPGLVPMFIEIHNMRVASFPHLTFIHVPREENTDAMRLVNEALDAPH